MLVKQKGFTLVEVIVILAVLAILAGIAVPMALRIFQAATEDATRQEMDNLKKAILGDARKLQSSFRSDFGFLGDIGCLPDDLRRLFTNSAPPLPSSLSAWSFDSTTQTGAGWKGPYITGAATGQETDEYTKDQWGNDYIYTVSGACPPSSMTATLTSKGPNGQADGPPPAGDDITISIIAGETTATVRGMVKDAAGVGLEAVPVEFHSPVNGTLTTTTANTNANGNYTFISVPFGPRGVKAKPRFVYSPGSVSVGPPANRTVSFNMVNFSEVNETVDRVRIDYTVGATWDQFTVDGSQLAPGGNFSSGQDVDLANRTITASPATRPSMRVFVDSPDAQLPDTTVTGQGTVVSVSIRFSVNMTGIPITVTINPSGGAPVSILKFTP